MVVGSELNMGGYRRYSRWLLVVASVGISAAVAIYFVIEIGSLPGREALTEIAFNDMVKAAIDIRLNQSQSLFQVLLLLVAALAGMIIAERAEDRIGSNDIAELIMVFCAAGLFAASIHLYLTYLSEIEVAFRSAGPTNAHDEKPMMPNVLSDQVDVLYVAQRGFLLAGALISGIALFSHRRFRVAK